VSANSAGGFVSDAGTTLVNSIVAGQTSGADFDGTYTDGGHNLVGGDPKLGPLQDNGGPTQTMGLLPGSPAVDAGVAIVDLTTDQRGVARPQRNGVDIGAFELQDVTAVIPAISPGSGVYENSVQVSITSTNAGASVRYTVDGSAPSTTNGILYTAPFNLTQTATVKAIAYNGGWLPSPVASAGFTVLAPLPYWRNLQGLLADGSQDLATPAGDGVSNLLKYAFNMAPNLGDLARFNNQVLPENGTAGLPGFGIDDQGRLVCEFVRRKATTNPGIAYIVETGPDLTNLRPLDLSAASVESINAVWERVTVTDAAITPKRFGRVRLTETGP
jgi:hypothetical protein